MKCIDDQDANALLQLHKPVNKFPDFVRYTVQRLKILGPAMGKVKITETLCRAGLHLGVTTVGRILKEDPRPDPGDAAPSTHVVTAKRPNHVWHVDLTAVSTSMGFWAPWLPFALNQRWPFCWWVAVVIDHYSRRAMGFAIFRHNPTSASLCARGKTPYKMYHEILPASQRPRVEPRLRWPRSSPCASPHAPIASHCGTPIRLDVRYHKGRKHLPIIELQRVA